MLNKLRMIAETNKYYKMPLARISHKVSTAEAQSTMSTAYPIYALYELRELPSDASS